VSRRAKSFQELGKESPRNKGVSAAGLPAGI
jgi:hypothetical protein